MAETSGQINKILLMGRKARTPKELEEVARMIASLSKDYSSPDYPKMSIDEFLRSKSSTASLSPKEMLESYYGPSLTKEIIEAGNYNIKKPVITPLSFPAIFDRIQARKDEEYGSSYSSSQDEPPTATVSSGAAARISRKNYETYQKWLNSDDPDLQERARKFFQANSLDPTVQLTTGRSPLEHEIGHHITSKNKEARLPILTNNQAFVASNQFEDFGAHTGIINETTQALSRLQREWFKEKGKRITNPKQFMKLVNSEKIPEFLTQEGRRILVYARNLKKVKETSKDENKKNAADEALKGLSEMIPAVVYNEKKYGLNLGVA